MASPDCEFLPWERVDGTVTLITGCPGSIVRAPKRRGVIDHVGERREGGVGHLLRLQPQ